ncbi:hypothetical protein KA001_03360 [Patescibacteria group bacterium]|nr:hypothetical protein [Patescibacteria group bacterium]
MPLLRFNKNIPNLDDCTSHELQHEGFYKLKIINIKFEEGYNHINEMSLQIKEGDPNLLFSLFVNKMDYPLNKMLTINKCFLFNDSDFNLKINLDKPFNFFLNYELCN